MVVLITPRQQQRWWLVQQTQSQHHNQGSSNPSCSWFWFFHSWFCKKMTWTCFSFVKRDGWCYKLSNTPTSLRYPFSCCNWMCISFGKFKKKISLSYWCINGLLSTAILHIFTQFGERRMCWIPVSILSRADPQWQFP